MNRIRRRFGAIKCAIRRDHPWTCSITVLPQINLEEHLHVCQRCGVVVKAELKPIDPAITALLARIDPGLAPEDQRLLMN